MWRLFVNGAEATLAAEPEPEILARNYPAGMNAVRPGETVPSQL